MQASVTATSYQQRNPDSLILQSGSQNACIGCSVTYLAVTVNETLRCSVGTPSTPVANMNSLRNDYNRTTYLTGGKTFSTSPTSLTISCWIKTSAFRNYHSFVGLQGHTDSPVIAGNSSGSIYSVIQSQIVAAATDNYRLVRNKWQHVLQLTNGDR